MKKSDSQLFVHLFLEMAGSLKNVNRFGDLSKAFAKMVMDSTRLLSEKMAAIDTKNYTDEEYACIADLYVETLAEVITGTLRSFAQDTSEYPYLLPESKLKKLKRYFADIIRSGFKNEVVVELFYNLFLMCCFPAFENSYKQQQKVTQESKKLKQSSGINEDVKLSLPTPEQLANALPYLKTDKENDACVKGAKCALRLIEKLNKKEKES